MGSMKEAPCSPIEIDLGLSGSDLISNGFMSGLNGQPDCGKERNTLYHNQYITYIIQCLCMMHYISWPERKV